MASGRVPVETDNPKRLLLWAGVAVAALGLLGLAGAIYVFHSRAEMERSAAQADAGPAAELAVRDAARASDDAAAAGEAVAAARATEDEARRVKADADANALKRAHARYVQSLTPERLAEFGGAYGEAKEQAAKAAIEVEAARERLACAKAAAAATTKTSEAMKIESVKTTALAIAEHRAGVALSSAGRHDDAIVHFSRSLDAKRAVGMKAADTLECRAVALIALGRSVEAAADRKAAGLAGP
jgi:cytoskeletal protein RodZ